MDNRELELVQMGTKDQQIHTVIKLDLNFELKVNQIMSQYLMPAISKLLLFRNCSAVRGDIDRGMDMDVMNVFWKKMPGKHLHRSHLRLSAHGKLTG